MRSLPPLTSPLAGLIVAAALAAAAAVAWGGRPRLDEPQAELTDDFEFESEVSSTLQPESALDAEGSTKQCAKPSRLLLAMGRNDSDEGNATAARRVTPGSEKWHRLRLEAIARRDPEAFAREARERLLAEAPLPEKVALLQVARRRDAPLADELWTVALDGARTGDARLQEAALLLLAKDAPASREACRRLLDCALRVPALDGDVRRRAAREFAANATDEQLEQLRPLLDEESDARVRESVLEGLRQNASGAAAALARAGAQPGADGS